MPSTISALLCLTAALAGADEGELQVGITPTVDVLSRHDRMNSGGGAFLSAAYGLRDQLAVEARLGCDRFRDLADPQFAHEDQVASLAYNSTRCSLVPWLTLRLGAEYVVALGAGLGYRFETRSDREVSRSGVRLAGLDSATHHQLVGFGRASLEYRFRETFSAGVAARAGSVIAGSEPELEVELGAVVSMFMYP